MFYMVNLAKFKGRIRFNDLSSDFIYKIIRQKILIDFGLDKPDIVAIENISGISKQNEKNRASYYMKCIQGVVLVHLK